MLFLFRLNLEKTPGAAVSLDDPVWVADDSLEDRDEVDRNELIVLIAHLI